MRHKITLALLLGMWASWSMVLAAEPRSDYFREQGRITALSVDSMTIVVDDVSYGLDTTTRVYTQTGQPLRLDTLKAGQDIQYNTTRQPNRPKPVITEMALLPQKN